MEERGKAGSGKYATDSSLPLSLSVRGLAGGEGYVELAGLGSEEREEEALEEDGAEEYES